MLLCVPFNPFLHSETGRKLKLQMNVLEYYSKSEKVSNTTTVTIVVVTIIIRRKSSKVASDYQSLLTINADRCF